jgi:hypothetical protein
MKVVTALQKFQYVSDNFKLVYSIDLQEYISYHSTELKPISISDLSGSYFDISKAYAPNQPKTLNIDNEIIPLFFSENKNGVYLLENGKIVFQIDIISEIFFHLSGWQELFAEKDKLNRLNYFNSLQKKYDFVQIPVVSVLYNELTKAIEIVSGKKLQHHYRPENKFYTLVSHDIDIIENIWKENLKNVLKTLNYRYLKQFLSSITYKKSFNEIAVLQEKYHFKSIFFFMGRKGQYGTFENADYQLNNPKIKPIIDELIEKDNKIGIHGGFETSFQPAEFEKDLNQFSGKISVNRFHFLMFDAIKTPSILDKNGIKYDFTLGFNDMPGFRNSTTFPFYLFDYQSHKSSSVIEFPLIIMDVTLFNAQYLNIQNPTIALNYLKPIIAKFEKFGGVLTINWHNNYFVTSKKESFKLTFERLLQEITGKSIFTTL